MDPSLINLCLAALFFVGIHIGVSGTPPVRARLVAAMGEQAYRGLFSAASIVGIVWLSMAYGRAAHVDIWGQVHGLKPVTLVLMLFAFVFAVIGITTPGPTVVGGEVRLRGEQPARGILRITRHPFLWGVILWAAAHLLVKGDLASLMLFGGLLLMCLAGTRSIDAKRRRSHGADWERFAGQTSNIPFAAILAGRNRLALAELGWWRPILALGAYLVALHLHGRLFGVSPLWF